MQDAMISCYNHERKERYFKWKKRYFTCHGLEIIVEYYLKNTYIFLVQNTYIE